MSRLVSLEEFNRERREEPAKLPGNGIACPWCGAELVDTDKDGTLLMSNPPQKNVHCPNCNWHGYRIA